MEQRVNLIQGIKTNSLTKNAFELTLSNYETQKRELTERKDLLDKLTFVNKMNELEMSISFAKLFVDNFSKISQAKGKE